MVLLHHLELTKDWPHLRIPARLGSGRKNSVCCNQFPYKTPEYSRVVCGGCVCVSVSEGRQAKRVCSSFWSLPQIFQTRGDPCACRLCASGWAEGISDVGWALGSSGASPSPPEPVCVAVYLYTGSRRRPAARDLRGGGLWGEQPTETYRGPPGRRVGPE